MFSTQLQFKFASIAEAKIAANSLSDMLRSRISVFDFQGLQVTVGKDGDVAISVRFDEMGALKNFERELPKILEDTKKELEYYRAGGILNFVLNEIISNAA